MKNSFLYLVLITNMSSLYLAQGNVGVNLSNPNAQLDVLSKDNTEVTKGFKITNYSGNEIFTVLNNGNVGINTGSPVSQFEITAKDQTKSVLKMSNLSSSHSRQNSSINYNKYSKLAIDPEGNVVSIYDIRNNDANAISFDGNYTTAAGGGNLTLCSVNKGSILRFVFQTPFVQGPSSVGAVKFADILWSAGTGFKVISSGHDFGNNASVYTLSITGEGTNVLTFDAQTGDDFVFEVINGNLFCRQINPSATPKAEVFRIFKSLRTR